MPSLLARAYALLKKEGFREGSPLVARKALQVMRYRLVSLGIRPRISQRKDYVILEKHLLPRGARASAQHADGLDVREGRGEEIVALRLRDWRRHRALLSDGYPCIVAYGEGHVVGWLWWTDRLQPDMQRYLAVLGDVELEEGDIWGLDFQVRPGHRGRGRSTQVFELLCSTLADQGYRRLRGLVVTDHRAALWLYETSGCRPVGSFTVTYVLSMLGIANRHLLVGTNPEHGPAHGLLVGRRRFERSSAQRPGS